MQIDTVVYFQVTDAKLFTYGVENPIRAIENLTATTLRNLVGELELDGTLTSRDTVNSKMRSILDEATDPWGIKINRVELKNILPPQDIQNAMEKQMRAERERREAILKAEGEKRSNILVAEGEKEAMILRAEAKKASVIAEAEATATAIKMIKKHKAHRAERDSKYFGIARQHERSAQFRKDRRRKEIKNIEKRAFEKFQRRVITHTLRQKPFGRKCGENHSMPETEKLSTPQRCRSESPRSRRIRRKARRAEKDSVRNAVFPNRIP